MPLERFEIEYRFFVFIASLDEFGNHVWFFFGFSMVLSFHPFTGPSLPPLPFSCPPLHLCQRLPVLTNLSSNNAVVVVDGGPTLRGLI